MTTQEQEDNGIITDPELIACLDRLGSNPYHYINGGEYVELVDGDLTAFRPFHGACGFVREFTYPIYRFDIEKLLTLMKERSN